jgi:hypothetical protein
MLLSQAVHGLIQGQEAVMAFQQTRANFPKSADGNVREPGFCQMVDSNGNLAIPDNGLVPQGGVAVSASSGNVANAIAAATLAARQRDQLHQRLRDQRIGGDCGERRHRHRHRPIGRDAELHGLPLLCGRHLGNPMLAVQFAPPFPASAANTAITVSCPALGAGNTNNVANIRGVRV